MKSRCLKEVKDMYKKILACGLALLMCGCSTKAAGNDQG